jgi:hypothetical protein
MNAKRLFGLLVFWGFVLVASGGPQSDRAGFDLAWAQTSCSVSCSGCCPRADRICANCDISLNCGASGCKKASCDKIYTCDCSGCWIVCNSYAECNDGQYRERFDFQSCPGRPCI